MDDLFTKSGAKFCANKQHRYALWRIWDQSKPMIMFIGLNPSTADDVNDDPTIRRVKRFANDWGYGGVYMMNCFSYISTNPNQLRDHCNTAINDQWLSDISKKCAEIVFAWGSFDIVKEWERDTQLIGMFPNAKALIINRDGTPRHPLYVKADTVPILFKPE